MKNKMHKRRMPPPDEINLGTRCFKERRAKLREEFDEAEMDIEKCNGCASFLGLDEGSFIEDRFYCFACLTKGRDKL